MKERAHERIDLEWAKSTESIAGLGEAMRDTRVKVAYTTPELSRAEKEAIDLLLQKLDPRFEFIWGEDGFRSDADASRSLDEYFARVAERSERIANPEVIEASVVFTALLRKEFEEITAAFPNRQFNIFFLHGTKGGHPGNWHRDQAGLNNICVPYGY